MLLNIDVDVDVNTVVDVHIDIEQWLRLEGEICA
jgi:hypothetical protein